MFRFTMMNHLCNDLQTVMDITRPPDRIRQDVTRSPGGVSTLFLTNCIGCHSGMDPMAQAFALLQLLLPHRARWERRIWPTGQIVYTAGQVQPKYHINNTNFPQGFSTPDDSWNNRWRTGPEPGSRLERLAARQRQRRQVLGAGTRGFQAFATCQVTRVFKDVCLRAPNTSADITQINTMVTSFQNGL
jgi:hypothetical protein